jgi:hypothetical protein
VPATHPRVYLGIGDLAALRTNARQLAARLAPIEEKVRRELSAEFSIAPYLARVPNGADPLDKDEASQARKKLVWESKFAALDGASPMADGAWLWLASGDPALRDLVKRRATVLAGLDPMGFISERNTGADGADIDFGNAVLVHELRDGLRPAARRIHRS